MSRKDKAKRSFAIAARKSEKDASIFSIRDMVEAKLGPAPGVLAAREEASWRAPAHGHVRPKLGAGVSNGKNGSAGGIKGQIKAGFKAEPMRKLCPDRNTRDKRSIDEIQRDIRAAKKVKEPEFSASKNGSSTPPTPARKPKPKPPPLPSSARPAPTAAAIAAPRRQRSPSEASTSSYESDRPRKRRRDDDDREMMERASVSAQIQAMFRRPGAAPRRYDEYSDDDSDMEAGLDDVEEEDRRAAAIARREDRLAEEEEKARKMAKEKAKRERLKGK
jgi:protein SPT2